MVWEAQAHLHVQAQIGVIRTISVAPDRHPLDTRGRRRSRPEGVGKIASRRMWVVSLCAKWTRTLFRAKSCFTPVRAPTSPPPPPPSPFPKEEKPSVGRSPVKCVPVMVTKKWEPNGDVLQTRKQKRSLQRLSTPGRVAHDTRVRISQRGAANLLCVQTASCGIASRVDGNDRGKHGMAARRKLPSPPRHWSTTYAMPPYARPW